jgi:hypothetical protein
VRIETAVHAGHAPDPATGREPPIALTTFAQELDGSLHEFPIRTDNPVAAGWRPRWPS